MTTSLQKRQSLQGSERPQRGKTHEQRSPSRHASLRACRRIRPLHQHVRAGSCRLHRRRNPAGSASPPPLQPRANHHLHHPRRPCRPLRLIPCPYRLHRAAPASHHDHRRTLHHPHGPLHRRVAATKLLNQKLHPRQLTHPKDHGPLQGPTHNRHLLPHGHRPRLSPLRPHLHRPPRRRTRRHGGTSPLRRNAARCPDDDAFRHRHCASADSGGKGGEQYQRENAAVVLSGGECDYDCDGGLVCGGGVLDGLKFAYYVTKRIM